ncbi:LOW QUALITY PROTEIN: putative N-acetyltransferase 16 [Galemys pyrenaicus]|uniref:Putative N-acetyltransferase 16 n=1 Tax=Galemys pyrenaicus TaxID=202257 RepID=A0A8J6DIM9_GALPY|nr:LOW QUALITY PROTEIN: putative N-acetyltransferase 16 [Galemys pyrenaicus]
MKVENSCGIATSEVPKLEKDTQRDAEPRSETRPQEAGAKSNSQLGLETGSLGAELGSEVKAKPRSELGPETGPLDFVLATEREFEEVLAISGGIYSGLDYLHSRYHSWLQDPDTTVVLAKLNSVVVALESVHVIDAGETVLVEGLRVAPWERSKGVAGLLQRFCSQLVKRQHPGVKVRQAATWRASCCHPPCSATCFRAGPSSKTGSPTGRVRNLRLLAAKGLEWCVDSRAHPRVLSLCTRPCPIPHGGDGTWRRLNIDTFGSDDEQVQSQFLWHLQRQVPRLAGLNVMCQLFLAPQLWSQLAGFCQDGLGLELVRGYTEQYLRETDI